MAPLRSRPRQWVYRSLPRTATTAWQHRHRRCPRPDSPALGKPLLVIALAIPIGLFIGLTLGALGGGGSILTVPALVYPVSYTHLRAHETRHDLVCRLLLE